LIQGKNVSKLVQVTRLMLEERIWRWSHSNIDIQQRITALLSIKMWIKEWKLLWSINGCILSYCCWFHKLGWWTASIYHNPLFFVTWERSHIMSGTEIWYSFESRCVTINTAWVIKKIFTTVGLTG